MIQDIHPDKLLSISEVSELTGVKEHLLRQWEDRFPQLKPRRLPSGKRVYSGKDIKIVRRLKTMLQHEGMTSRGARLKLAQELREAPVPKDLSDMAGLADKIANEARAIIALYDPETSEDVSE